MEEEKIYDMTDETVESRYVQELKDRSYANCLTTAYHNVVDNFKSLFDQVWKLALVYSVIFGITMAVRYTTLSVDKPFAMLLNLLTSAATVVAGIVYVGKIFEFLNGHDFKYNSKKILTIGVVCYAIAIAFFMAVMIGAIFLALGTRNPMAIYVAIWGAVLVWVVFLIVWCTPLCYSGTKFLMDDNTHLIHVLGKDWKKGFKHFGFIFTTLFLESIVVGVINLLIFSPLIVIVVACLESYHGANMGDPMTMPSSLFLPICLLAIISMFVNCFLIIWQAFTYYYIYGTIETRDYETNEAESLVH